MLLLAAGVDRTFGSLVAFGIPRTPTFIALLQTSFRCRWHSCTLRIIPMALQALSVPLVVHPVPVVATYVIISTPVIHIANANGHVDSVGSFFYSMSRPSAVDCIAGLFSHLCLSYLALHRCLPVYCHLCYLYLLLRLALPHAQFMQWYR
jgi:hypothetical protein